MCADGGAAHRCQETHAAVTEMFPLEIAAWGAEALPLQRETRETEDFVKLWVSPELHRGGSASLLEAEWPW